MNYRYFYKRAYYMACLAAGLQETSAYNYRLSFEQQHGNPLLPVLVMKSGTGTILTRPLLCSSLLTYQLQKVAKMTLPNQSA